jgi:hypothetical protein
VTKFVVFASNNLYFTELRLRNVKVDSHAFHCLSKLTKLITLDLSTTKISDEPLNAILKANPLLKHINLGEHVQSAVPFV